MIGRNKQKHPHGHALRIPHPPVHEVAFRVTAISSMSAQSRRAQAQQDYKSMLTELHQCLPAKLQESMAQLSFPSTDDSAPFDIQVTQMEAAIIPLINIMDGSPDAKSKSRKVKSLVTGWFRASYPFTRLLLNVAHSGSSVRSKTNFSCSHFADDIVESIWPCLRRSHCAFRCTGPLHIVVLT